MATVLRCTSCGAEDLEPGFVPDTLGNGAPHRARWVEGYAEHAMFGGVKVRGKRQLPITVFRCRKCSHLELFADPGMVGE